VEAILLTSYSGTSDRISVFPTNLHSYSHMEKLKPGEPFTLPCFKHTQALLGQKKETWWLGAEVNMVWLHFQGACYILKLTNSSVTSCGYRAEEK